jgi:hypothetical protein
VTNNICKSNIKFIKAWKYINRVYIEKYQTGFKLSSEFKSVKGLIICLHKMNRQY